MKVAYNRVSSSSQSLEVQRDEVQKENVERIFEENVSAISTKGRVKLKEMLELVREGDEHVITRVNRLARSVLDLQLIVQELTDKGVNLTVTEQLISTKDATSCCFYIYSRFLKFWDNIRREIQIEGIAKEKAKGIYKGGKQVINVEKIKKLKQMTICETAIASQIFCHRDGIYFLLKQESK